METDHDFGDDEYHGSDGPVPVRRSPRDEWLPHSIAFQGVCVDEGFPIHEDQNHPESTGVSPRARNTIDGIRMSMAINYLDPVRHRPNLTIKADTTARRILFRGNRAVGAAVDSAGEIGALAGNEIIVSSGAIASPQLLMLSGIGAEEQLRRFGIPVLQDLPGVGRNLRDHPTAAVLYRAGEKSPTFMPR